MAGLQPHEEGLSIAKSHCSAFDLPSRSKTINRGAGCLKGARPDLWGAGEGNPSLVYPTDFSAPVSLQCPLTRFVSGPEALGRAGLVSYPSVKPSFFKCAFSFVFDLCVFHLFEGKAPFAVRKD